MDPKELINFDQYQRYATVSRLIDFHRLNDSEKTFKILELGSNEHKDLAMFLKNDKILFTDICLTDKMKNDSDFMQIDGTSMPFDDNEFDFVVSCDVLEHVPSEKRIDFISEANRVAKIGAIICFPNNTEDVRGAEYRVNAYYKALFGKDHIWLKEHIENGLPNISDIDNFLNKGKLNYFRFSHGTIDVWEKIMYCYFNSFVVSEASEYKALVDNYYNYKIYPFDVGESCYRSYYVISENKIDSWKDYSNKLWEKHSTDSEKFLNLLVQSHYNVHPLHEEINNNAANKHDINLGKIYFDCNGLSEENAAQVSIKRNEIMTGRVAIPNNCTAIRFDPIENTNCIISSLIINSNNGILSVESGNYNKKINDSYYFFNTDPQFYITLPVGTSWIEISCSIIIIDSIFHTKILTELLANVESRANEIAVLKDKFETEVQQYQEEKSALAAQHEREITTLKNEIESEKYQHQEEKSALAARHESEIANLKNEIESEKNQSYKERLAYELQHEEEISALKKDFELQHKEEISTLTNDFEDKKNNLSNQLSIVQQRNSNLQCELDNCRAEYNSAIMQRDSLREEAASWQNSYNIINNSEFWKITKPARKLLDIIKGISAKSEPAPDVTGIDKKHIYLGSISPKKASLALSEITDIIIPVYNGFEYLEALLASIENTKAAYRLIIIDDKSTDKRVLPFLKKYEKGKNNVILLENKNNLGFVKTVNRGLRESKNNVALVNTDVVLPPMWLERLMLPIVANRTVATSTPFTNCGTICSFPVFCQDNKLFFGMDLNEIDKAFSDYTPKYPIIPTGVGFCMGMSRNAIDKVGVLDEDTFGKGYGEENDWCRRAAEEGFVNVHVENLFVYHKHGGSFESEEKKALINEHLKLLSQKHPDYDRLVAEYCQLDPCATMRTETKKKLLKNNLKLHTIVAFNHSWGGGAGLYLERERTKKLYEGNEFVQVEYMPDGKAFRAEFFYGEYYETYNIESENITELLNELPDRVDEIWINELVTYPDLYGVLEKIGTYAKAKKAYLLHLLHDYFSICPTVNLIKPDQVYCRLPQSSACQECLENNPRFNHIHQKERKSGMSTWRENWSMFFENCSEIRVFSESSKEILCKAYPNINVKKITVKPHTIDYLPNISKKRKRTKSLNIGVIGAIEGIKGLEIVRQMALMIKKYNFNVNITVIGVTHPAILEELCHNTGYYKRYSLPTNILEYDIDVVLIPSIWPETFSYTSQEAMKMGLPVACFNHGAPAERVKNYDKGIIIPQVGPDSALHSIMKYADRYIKIKPKNNKKVLFLKEILDYATRYRAEHFMEELKFHGISSDFLYPEEAVEKDLSEYSSIIFYRNSKIIAASYISDQAKKHNIKLFFDIDDLVFDKEIIMSSNLPAEEKKQYVGLAECYCDIINKCDGVITSTEVLAKHLRHSFKQKPVCVRRNSASLEMETLSVCAGDKEITKEAETINIAYFSGSWTHDRDFKIIINPLLSIFKKYSNVKLQIYGCLNIPEELKEYKSRIETYDFDFNWRTLPEKVAKAHIHLAPLEDTVFNECKSENKWTEAALTGRPVVASKVSEMKLVIKNGVNGFLCSTEKEWEETLSKLIENKDLRNKVGKNAQEEVLRTHLTRNNGDEAVKFISGKI